MTSLAIPRALAVEIRDLLSSAPDEAAGMLYCHSAQSMGSTRLLGVFFHAYQESDYEVRTPGSLRISPVAVNRHLQRAREERFSLVQVHTHPSAAVAQFSYVDTAGEREMLPVVTRRVPGLPHGTLVVGQQHWAARVYLNATDRQTARILEVGHDIVRLDSLTSEGDARFDRSVRVMGRAGQAALRDMRVAIVGLGGTGSIAAQQLAFLGIRDVVLVDNDVVERTNLNRLVGATQDDIGTAKVDVAAREYRRFESAATVRAIQGNVVDESVARQILDRDVILCCTDSQASRGVLNWLAYQYFIPTIDCGVQITVREETVDSISARVQMIGPGLPCLHCCDVLDLDRVREEMLTDEQRSQDRYIVGASVEQPAVISINGIATSLATTMLMAATSGIALAPRMQTYNGLKGEVRPGEAQARSDCPVCSASGLAYGWGDARIPIWRQSGQPASS